MTLSLSLSSQDLVVCQHGGTSDYGKSAVLRPIYSAASPHNNNSVVVSNVLGTILSSWGPNILCGSLHGHVRTQPNNASAFTLAINVLKAQFIQYRRHVHALEAEIDDLRHDNMMYHSDVGALESELSKLRADYYSEVSERRQTEKASEKDKDEIEMLKAEIIVLKDKNSQAERDKDEISLLKAEINRVKAAYSQAQLDKHEEMRELTADIEVLREERSQSELDGYEIKLLKAEIDVLKEEHCRAELDKCEIKLLKAEIDALKEEHSQAEDFIQAMVDIKLYDSVLSDAAQSVLEGGDTEDALIEAVKAASTRKGSAWSRIIPAVVGPRTPEHYLSALDLALKARKELHKRRRISGFWKLRALMDPANTSVITPSSSQISDICDEMAKGQNRPRELVPMTQIEDVCNVAQVTAVVPLIDPSESMNSAVLEPPLVNTIADIHTESMEAIKILTSPPSPQSSFTIEQNEDDSYSPSEDESVETVRPSASEIDFEHAAEDDLRGSFCAIEQDTELPEQDNIQPKSDIQSEPESDIQLENNIQPESVVQSENTAGEKSNTSSPSLSARPSTPPQGSPISALTTPSKSFRSSPANRKPVTPRPRQEKSRPRLISPFKSPPPTKYLGASRVAEFLSTSRKNSELFVKPLKTLGRPTSPIRSRLSIPRNHASKRPALQNINLNTPSPLTTNKPNGIGEKKPSKYDAAVVETPALPKPMTKDFRKRRGVIMVEKVDIDRSLTNTDKIAHLRTKSQGKVHNLPRFPASTSNDVFIDRRNDNVNRSGKTATESEKKDLVVDKQGSSDSKAAPSSEKPSITELQPPEQDSQTIAIVSPTTLIVSRLVEQFSDSDLGSLEMTSDDDSDSDCEEIRRVQNDLDDLPTNLSTLPHIQRALAEEASTTLGRKTVVNGDHEDISYAKDGNNDDDDLGSCSVISTRLSASGLSVARTSRPATPYSKSSSRTLNAKDNERLSPSTSGSSYATSSSGSDSPAKRASRLPLLGLARRLRHGSGSFTLVKEAAAPSALPVIARGKTSLPVTSPVESAKSLVRSTPKSTSKPLASISIWNMRNKITGGTSEEATPLTPPRKVAISSKTTPHSKLGSGFSRQRKSPVPEPKPSKPSMGQSFIRRLSNTPISKQKPNTTQSVRTDPIHLAPPSPGSLTKPRSHTINVVSPLPPTLSTPSPEALKAGSTKPRSHTVNTYSPTIRSPLSRLAADASAEYKANQSPKVSPLPKSLVPKHSPSSRTGAAAVKASNSTLPLRVYNKSSSSKRQASQSSEETSPTPPTAAFMRPAASPASNTRRMTNSIAPLIPNWIPATANGGGLTPKQCRSMFRNSLSMVVR